jgi:hypothetical protein
MDTLENPQQNGTEPEEQEEMELLLPREEKDYFENSENQEREDKEEKAKRRERQAHEREDAIDIQLNQEFLKQHQEEFSNFIKQSALQDGKDPLKLSPEEKREYQKQFYKHEREIRIPGLLVDLVLPEPKDKVGREKRELVEQKRDRLQEVLTQWETVGAHDRGLESFFASYFALFKIHDEAKREEALRALEQELHQRLGEEFTEADIQGILRITREQRHLYQVLILNRKFEAALSIRNGEFHDEAVDILQQDLPLDRKFELLDLLFQEAAVVEIEETGRSTLKDFLELERQAQREVHAVEEFERKQREAQERAREPSAQGLGSLSLFAGLAYLSEDAARGRREKQEEALRGLSPEKVHVDKQNNVLAEVEGAIIKITPTGKILLLEEGEEVEMRDMSAGEFDEARTHIAALITESALFERESFLQEPFLRKAGIDPRDQIPMAEGDFELLKSSFLTLLKGKRHREEEIDALQELHILTVERKPSPQYLLWFGAELRDLRRGRDIPLEEHLTFEDLKNLSNEWYKNGFRLLPLHKIKELSQRER